MHESLDLYRSFIFERHRHFGFPKLWFTGGITLTCDLPVEDPLSHKDPGREGSESQALVLDWLMFESWLLCRFLGKLCNRAELQFYHVQNRDNNIFIIVL